MTNMVIMIKTLSNTAGRWWLTEICWRILPLSRQTSFQNNVRPAHHIHHNLCEQHRHMRTPHHGVFFKLKWQLNWWLSTLIIPSCVVSQLASRRGNIGQSFSWLSMHRPIHSSAPNRSAWSQGWVILVGETTIMDKGFIFLCTTAVWQT